MFVGNVTEIPKQILRTFYCMHTFWYFRDIAAGEKSGHVWFFGHVTFVILASQKPNWFLGNEERLRGMIKTVCKCQTAEATRRPREEKSWTCRERQQQIICGWDFSGCSTAKINARRELKGGAGPAPMNKCGNDSLFVMFNILDRQKPNQFGISDVKIPSQFGVF